MKSCPCIIYFSSVSLHMRIGIVGLGFLEKCKYEVDRYTILCDYAPKQQKRVFSKMGEYFGISITLPNSITFLYKVHIMGLREGSEVNSTYCFGGDLNSVPSTHAWQLATICNFSTREIWCLWLWRAYTHVHIPHTETYTCTELDKLLHI